MIIDLNDEKIQLERNGVTKEYDVLFTFESEDTMKYYIGYTDNTFASDGRKNIYVSSYNPYDLKTELEAITDERELAMVNDVLEQIDSASGSYGG